MKEFKHPNHMVKEIIGKPYHCKCWRGNPVIKECSIIALANETTLYAEKIDLEWCEGLFVKVKRYDGTEVLVNKKQIVSCWNGYMTTCEFEGNFGGIQVRTLISKDYPTIITTDDTDIFNFPKY